LHGRGKGGKGRFGKPNRRAKSDTGKGGKGNHANQQTGGGAPRKNGNALTRRTADDGSPEKNEEKTSAPPPNNTKKSKGGKKIFLTFDQGVVPLLTGGILGEKKNWPYTIENADRDSLDKWALIIRREGRKNFFTRCINHVRKKGPARNEG